MARKKAHTAEATHPQGGLPTNSLKGAGLEALGPEDLIIPRLVLVQPTSQIDGVEAGKFYMNLTGEEFTEVQAVFLRVTKGRVNFGEDTNERKPICGMSLIEPISGKTVQNLSSSSLNRLRSKPRMSSKISASPNPSEFIRNLRVESGATGKASMRGFQR